MDLLLRTSGEARLSDFLLWQAGGAALAFAPALWPELAFTDLLRALVRFQRAAPRLVALRAAAAAAAAAAADPPAALAAGAVAQPCGTAARVCQEDDPALPEVADRARSMWPATRAAAAIEQNGVTALSPLGDPGTAAQLDREAACAPAPGGPAEAGCTVTVSAGWGEADCAMRDHAVSACAPSSTEAPGGAPPAGCARGTSAGSTRDASRSHTPLEWLPGSAGEGPWAARAEAACRESLEGASHSCTPSDWHFNSSLGFGGRVEDVWWRRGEAPERRRGEAPEQRLLRRRSCVAEQACSALREDGGRLDAVPAAAITARF